MKEGSRRSLAEFRGAVRYSQAANITTLDASGGSDTLHGDRRHEIGKVKWWGPPGGETIANPSAWSSAFLAHLPADRVLGRFPRGSLLTRAYQAGLNCFFAYRAAWSNQCGDAVSPDSPN